MKKIVLILLGVVFTLNLVGQSNKSYYVISNVLNLRTQPKTDAELIVKLSQYDNITLLKDSLQIGWAKVKFGEIEGFVYKQYIKKGKANVTNYEIRVGAVCRDGTRSSATGRGACSHHGGVSYWLTEKHSLVRIDEEY